MAVPSGHTLYNGGWPDYWSWPPAEGDDFWNYFAPGGDFPPDVWNETALYRRLIIPGGFTGISRIESIVPLGYGNTFDTAFWCTHDLEYLNTLDLNGERQFRFRVESLDTSNWMQIRIDFVVAGTGHNNNGDIGDYNLFFEDSNGATAWTTVESTWYILHRFPISYIYLSAGGVFQLRWLNASSNNGDHTVTMTPNLFADGEQYRFLMEYEHFVAQSSEEEWYPYEFEEVYCARDGVETELESTFEELDGQDTFAGDSEALHEPGGIQRTIWSQNVDYKVPGTVYSLAAIYDHWEWGPTVTGYQENSGYHRINFSYGDPPFNWILRYKAGLPWEQCALRAHSGGYHNNVAFGLINSAGTKGFYLQIFDSEAGDPFKIVEWPSMNVTVADEQGEPSSHSQSNTSNNFYIDTFRGKGVVVLSNKNYSPNWYGRHPIDLSDYFEPGEMVHPCYIQYYDTYYCYIGYYYNPYFPADDDTDGDAIIQSPVIPFNPDEGQDPGNIMYCQGAPLDILEGWKNDVEEYTMFYRTKVINPENAKDENSLKGIDPEFPCDIGQPLRERDACIVKDRYNRWYFYQVSSGDMADSLPDIMRIDSTRYWELVDYVAPSKFVCEQHDIVGLVDTNEVIITYTATLDDESAKAPAIQIINDGVVKTDEITVSVVSDTQLRFATTATEVFTNLKVNLYFTAI